MLPTAWVHGGWPHSGEIDIMEHVGYDPARVHGTVHTGAYNHILGTQVGGSAAGVAVEEWHTYSIDWTRERIRFLLDGGEYARFARPPSSGPAEWPFDERFYLLLNIAVGGSWGGAQGVDE